MEVDAPERVSARREVGGVPTDSSFFILFFMFLVETLKVGSVFSVTGREEEEVRVVACHSRGRPPPLIGWP